MAALAAVCVLATAPASAGSTLRIGNGPEPETLDPQKVEGVSAGNIVRDLYEGLTAIAGDGRPVAAAAHGWTVSDEGLVYTFNLREDARWSNGDPVTAEDFVAGLRRGVDPQTGSAFAQLLEPVRNAAAIMAGTLTAGRLGVVAEDAHTLRIELERPTPYLPGLLAHPVSFPAHRSAPGARGEPGISNGAYRLAQWTAQAHVELVRNEHYWNAAQTSIERVRYVTTEDIHAELRRYLAGELDVTYEVPPTQAARLRRDLPGQLRLAPYLGVYYYGLNVGREPLRGRPELRRALSMVIDRDVIAERVLNGLAAPAWNWVPPGVSGYRTRAPDWANWPRERRVAEARRLYAAAGYSDAQPLELEIRYNTHESHRRVAIVVAAMWKQALGVRTRLRNEEFKVFLHNRRLRRDTQVFRAAWIADYDDPSSFFGVLHSAHGKNDSGWHDAGYDALLQRAADTVDAQARAQLWAQAEEMLLAEVPVIPLYFYRSKHLVAPRVRGWTDNVLDYHYSKDLHLVR